jgi:hypothetical protein
MSQVLARVILQTKFCKLAHRSQIFAYEILQNCRYLHAKFCKDCRYWHAKFCKDCKFLHAKFCKDCRYLHAKFRKQSFVYNNVTLLNMSLRSALGFVHEATASQKKMKSARMPLGFAWIMWHIPRKALSFSSLSRMFRSDEHLTRQRFPLNMTTK